MSEVKIWVKDKNKYVGSMLRGLATQIGGQQTAKGNNNQTLEKRGYFVFHFKKQSHADDFMVLSKKYLGDYTQVDQ